METVKRSELAGIGVGGGINRKSTEGFREVKTLCKIP